MALAFSEWERLRDRHDAALNALNGAWASCVEPPLPPFRFGIDRGLSVPGPVVNGRRPALCNPSDGNVEGLRATAALNPSGDPWKAAWERSEIPKARATLAKIEAYRAERDWARAEASIPALQDAATETGRALDKQSEAILAMAPTTLREWAMHAAVALEAGENPEEFLERLSAAA